MKTLAAVVLLIAVPAIAAEPVIGPERAVSPYRSAPRTGYKYFTDVAGGAGGFLAVWGEQGDRYRVFGAHLTPDGKLAGDPFIIGVSAPAALRVRPLGAGYIVYEGGYASWEVQNGSVRLVEPVGESPAESESGEHLVITSEAGQFTVTFVDRNGQMHGPPLRTKDIVSPSTLLRAVPSGDDWLLLTRGWNDVIQWTRLNHAGFTSMSVVMPVLPSTSFGASLSLSRLAINGADVAFAWARAVKLDNVPNPEWERTLGYTTVNMESGGSFERRADTTRMRVNAFDSRQPSPGTPAAIYDGHEFVYAWTWLNYPGDAELRVVNGTGAPRVFARHRDAFPYDFRPALAAGQGRNLIAWHPDTWLFDPYTRYDAVARVFDASSSIDDGVAPTLVTAGVPAQHTLRQAWGPNGALAAWSETGEQFSIRGRFIPASSNDGEPFTLFDGEGAVSVAASADTFLVALREYTRRPPYTARLMLRRFDRNGIAVDAQPVVFGTGYLNYGKDVSILPDGDSFILAWSVNTSSYALRVPSRGALTSAPVKISDTKNVAEPHLARVAGRPVVVWVSMVPDSGTYTIKGARLRDTLELEQVVDMWVAYTRATAGAAVLSVDGNDKELMIGAGSGLFGEAGDCVRTRRFNSSLQPVSEPSMLGCTAAAAIYNISNAIPAVAWDGQRWWALFSSATLSFGEIRLFPYDANGIPQPPLFLGDPEPGHFDVSLRRTPQGVTMLYSHYDEDAAAIMRAFQLPVLTQQQKTRSARH